jgi:hypothetical protein
MANAFYIIRTAGASFPRVPFWESPQFARDVADAIAALNAAPSEWPGRISQTATPTAPPGWLMCDGSALRRKDYPALFDAIGTRFGAGDGSTTFNIPTQEQAQAPITEPTPPQTIVGGSVVPATPVTPQPGNPGPGGGNSTTGGRQRFIDEQFVQED